MEVAAGVEAHLNLRSAAPCCGCCLGWPPDIAAAGSGADEDAAVVAAEEEVGEDLDQTVASPPVVAAGDCGEDGAAS